MPVQTAFVNVCNDRAAVASDVATASVGLTGRQSEPPMPVTNTATNAEGLNLAATADAIDLIADIVFDNESFDLRLDRLVIAAKQAKMEADAAAKHLAQIRAEILSTMIDSGLASFDCPDGKVTVCKGKRTVSVTDKALAAEIALIKERGVRTGRCTEKQGADYVIIK